MTIEEAIAHAKETADTRTDLCDDCREEHRQLAQWLTELKQLCEENDTLKTEIMAVKSGSDVLKICKLEEENRELKRLLKLAVEDMKKVSDDNCCYHCIYGNPITRHCEEYKGNENCYKWQHAEEAERALEEMKEK